MVRQVAAGQVEPRQIVTAIADQDERTAPDQIVAVDGQGCGDTSQAPPRPGGGDDPGETSRVSAALELSALVHHPRIAAETDVVQEVPIVDDADVDSAGTSGPQQRDGRVEL